MRTCFFFAILLSAILSKAHGFRHTKSGLRFSKLTAETHSGNYPLNPIIQCRKASISISGLIISCIGVVGTRKAHATDYENKKEGIYVEPGSWSIEMAPSWIPLPKKLPKSTLMKYQTEEIVFVGTSFAEASSLSISKTSAPRLLKDFNIEVSSYLCPAAKTAPIFLFQPSLSSASFESYCPFPQWWFGQIEKISDVGPPDLVAELLVLQRQGDFEKKETPSIIRDAKFEDDQTLSFEFETPLAAGVTRKTSVKAVLQKAELYVAWVSALESIWEGNYGADLLRIRNSFHLL